MPNDAVPVTAADVIAFLRGEGELEGCSFGERPPGVIGNFWWRKYLPLLAPAQDTVLWGDAGQMLADHIIDHWYEMSKLDHFTIVGSEVRQLIGDLRRARAAIAAFRRDGDAVLARAVHEAGPVVVDWYGEALAWRPLNVAINDPWTPLTTPPIPSQGGRPMTYRSEARELLRGAIIGFAVLAIIIGVMAL